MQVNTSSSSASSPASVQTGGLFMDPNMIVGSFGLTEGMRVTDFGSGAGFFTVLMAKRVGQSGEVTAIDLLDSALDTLKSKASMEGLNNIKTVKSNLENTGASGLGNESQDLVLIANTLFQNPDKNPIINEASRVLKPSGTLAIVEWKKGAGGFGPPDQLRTDPEEMKKLVEGFGFVFVQDVDSGAFHYGVIFRKI